MSRPHRLALGGWRSRLDARNCCQRLGLSWTRSSRPGVHRYGILGSARAPRASQWAELDIPAFLRAVRRAFRAMAHRVHPDHGGEEAAMADLNLAYTWLMRRANKELARRGSSTAPASPPNQRGR